MRPPATPSRLAPQRSTALRPTRRATSLGSFDVTVRGGRPRSPTQPSPQRAPRGSPPGVNVTATFTGGYGRRAPPTGIQARSAAQPSSSSRAGTTTVIGAVVSYDATAKKATLNPNANLRLGTKYKAVVTTGAKDLAGNQLDQNSRRQMAYTANGVDFHDQKLVVCSEEGLGVGACSSQLPRAFLLLVLIHPSAWNTNSRKFGYRILHSHGPTAVPVMIDP